MHKYKRLTFIDEQILMNLSLYDFRIYNLHHLQKVFTPFRKKNNGNKNNKNILYKKETTCRDVKTKKVCKQDRDGIVGRVKCVVPQ